jgi:hypothetical protein
VHVRSERSIKRALPLITITRVIGSTQENHYSLPVIAVRNHPEKLASLARLWSKEPYWLMVLFTARESGDFVCSLQDLRAETEGFQRNEVI